MPELREAKKARFGREYGLGDYDAAQLPSSKALADYFEDAVRRASEPKLAANWILSELSHLLKEAGKEITEIPVSSEHLAELLGLVAKGTVSGKMGKDILAEMF